jgi:hypothetical protein
VLPLVLLAAALAWSRGQLTERGLSYCGPGLPGLAGSVGDGTGIAKYGGNICS